MHRAVISTCETFDQIATRLTESEKTKFPCSAENWVGKVTTLPAMLQRKRLSQADFCAGQWMEEMDYQVINHTKELASARTHEQGDTHCRACQLLPSASEEQ